MTLRVAAIDCGTNSIRLLIADVENGKLTDVVRTMVIVRLGEGVDKTGEFSQAALARTFAAIDTYSDLIAKYKPELVRFVATSASRDVSNRDEFV
jgi:exopolyphosphatase/guanosine-5'-triphosphate,3'-diphosphate pyrophosphatase